MTSSASGPTTAMSGLGSGWTALGSGSGPPGGLSPDGEDEPLFLQIRLAELSGALATMDRSLHEARRSGIPVTERHTRLAADIWAAQRLLRRIAAELCQPCGGC
ncbi:MAG: hypothetical protein NZ523_06350 [Elioraea sp.]|nr:hypothetical protein [Elioraea sp.]